MLGSIDKKFHSPFPFSKETRGLRLILLMFGLKFLEDNKHRRRFANLMSIVYSCFWLGFTYHVIWVAAKTPAKREVCGVLFFFLGCALFSWISLRRNIEKIQQVLLSICIFIREKDLKIVKKYDFLMTFMTLFLFGSANAVAFTYIFTHLDIIRTVLRKNGVAEECLTNIFLMFRGFTFFFSYGATINGIVVCSTGLYATIMIIFKLFCNHIKEITLQVMNDMTAENICVVRKHLRVYWTVKTNMDQLLNVFPFVWLSYCFVSITILFTLMIVDWKEQNERHPFVLLTCYLTFLTWVCFVGKFFMIESADRAFQDTLQAAFGLTDPRFRSTVTDEKLMRQIHLLHHELTNCPKSHNTILGMARFSRKTIINYSAALVNFAVMMINIRMALRDSSSLNQSCPPCGSMNSSTIHIIAINTEE